MDVSSLVSDRGARGLGLDVLPIHFVYLSISDGLALLMPLLPNALHKSGSRCQVICLRGNTHDYS